MAGRDKAAACGDAVDCFFQTSRPWGEELVCSAPVNRTSGCLRCKLAVSLLTGALEGKKCDLNALLLSGQEPELQLDGTALKHLRISPDVQLIKA